MTKPTTSKKEFIINERPYIITTQKNEEEPIAFTDTFRKLEFALAKLNEWANKMENVEWVNDYEFTALQNDSIYTYKILNTSECA